jgi:ADP-heptose:LPS heptosyltransferase
VTHTIVVRLDGMGDMVVSGPAVRAVVAGSSRVTVLAGPDGAPAARLLPGVDDVVLWSCPWIRADPPPVTRPDVTAVVDRLARVGADRALILTSFHQSALPSALLLRLAGVAEIAAISEDYPGSLLDLRLAPPPRQPEPLRMLAVAAAAGYPLPADDDGRLAIRLGLTEADIAPLADFPYGGGFVVVHPGVTAPARAYPNENWRDVVRALTRDGWTVAVTGSQPERSLTAELVAAAVGPGRAVDCGGRYDLEGLAHLLRSAAVVVAANTGPAHLAAAVGTPVVSLFAPVVDPVLWAPYGVPTVILGDQNAPCRGSRARSCPVAGHPCLTSVGADSIAAAVRTLAGRRAEVPA